MNSPAYNEGIRRKQFGEPFCLRRLHPVVLPVLQKPTDTGKHKPTQYKTHTHTRTHTHTKQKTKTKTRPDEKKAHRATGGKALHFIIFWSGTELVNENKQTNEQWKIWYLSVNRLIRGMVELKLIADYRAAGLFT